MTDLFTVSFITELLVLGIYDAAKSLEKHRLVPIGGI